MEKNFGKKDVVFECIHNFAALSQWGNTIYNIMLKLGKNTGASDARASFKRTMKSNLTKQAARPFTPLERFRDGVIPYDLAERGSISALEEVRTPPYQRYGYIITPHPDTSFDPVHWKDPKKFDPDRYNDVLDEPPDRRSQV